MLLSFGLRSGVIGSFWRHLGIATFKNSNIKRMKQIKILIFMALFFSFGNIFGQTKQKETEEKGIIGQYTENGYPVIMKFVNELPEKQILDRLPLLVVVSWKYDGGKNNGMPEKKNQ
jgi:hypothetical protein